MGERSILDIPFGNEWTWEAIDEFLQGQIAENDRIEYKEEMSETFLDTLASFANGEGGYLVLGVEEVPGRKIPKGRALLEKGKSHVATVYHKAAAELSPRVRFEVIVRQHPTTKQRLVIVKV